MADTPAAKKFPKKSLGQHFLRCEWVCGAIIAAAHVGPTDTVLEIGPGTGVLTRPLAALARHVIAVEKDERLAAELATAFARDGISNVRIIAGDILKHLPDLPGYDKIVANIPYYLTGRLMRLVMEGRRKPRLAALTVQKEVALRMTARPPHMNLLALGVQAYGAPALVKTIPASCFAPPPKVDSAIVVISDISDDFFIRTGIAQGAFFALARAAFGQKRKTLANSLTPLVGDKTRALALIRAAGMSDVSRPEELSREQWAALIRNFMQ
jgi:16S rRNA (adenine1518-N6/adenine1519-N6)-dimethyltransferase